MHGTKDLHIRRSPRHGNGAIIMTIREKLFRGQSIYENFPYDPTKVDLQGWGGTHGIFAHCINKIKPKLIIEVGTWKGRSAITMAKCLRRYGLAGEILCVDTWLGNPQHWLAPKELKHSADTQFWYESLRIENGYPNLYKTFLNNVISQNLQEYITPLPLPSESAFFVLDSLGVKADMIYIDAGHEYESVERDIRLYWQLLNDGGVMLFDDYNSYYWKGVTKAVNEFAAKNNLHVWSEVGKGLISKNNKFHVRTKYIIEKDA